MNESKFHMWRASFSFCFIDGFFNAEERKWIEAKINSLPFSSEEKQILSRDLDSPPDISSLLPHITSAADRGFLINNIRLLSQIDGSLSEAERTKINALTQDILSRIDLNAAKKEVQDDELESYHEDEVYKIHNKTSLFEKVVRNLQKGINPGNHKFPK